MKQVRGIYSRSRSPYIEMEAKRSDSYLVFARKAAKTCRLADEPGLVQLNGARILDESITVRGRSTSTVRPWTLGNYLLLMKKSPSLCKIGVAYAQPLHDNSDDSVSILLLLIFNSLFCCVYYCWPLWYTNQWYIWTAVHCMYSHAIACSCFATYSNMCS